MPTLQSFYDDFQKRSEPAVRQLWKYSEYETKMGTRREITFIGGSVVIQEMPPANELSVLVMQVSDTRVYRHTAYLLTFLADTYLVEADQQLKILLHGNAYQAFVPVNTFKVEPQGGAGTIERVDRFGNSSEKEVSRVHAVVVSRLPQPKENHG